jgi:RNA polymerase sigma-70 factor (ECF subfamily)
MQRRIPLNPRTRRFELATLPHLDAAYNLARWLLRDAAQAEDAVQEACLRAFAHFDELRGADARPWLLRIVRNACFDMLRQARQVGETVEFDDERDGLADAGPTGSPAPPADPADLWEQRARGRQVDAAIAALAPAFREVIVLRELEELSYEEIAHVAGIPIGTVMSRLSRARSQLRLALQDEGSTVRRLRKRDAQG